MPESRENEKKNGVSFTKVDDVFNDSFHSVKNEIFISLQFDGG